MAGVKLKDIAEKTGVSISTVSRILSGDTERKMKDETIRSVIDTAKKMGWYETKQERIRHSMPLIRMCCIWQEEEDPGDRETTREMLDGIRLEMKEKEKAMRLQFSLVEVSPKGLPDSFFRERWNGVIVIGRAAKQYLPKLREKVPYVLYAGVTSAFGVDQVVCDAREGVKEAVRYLYEKGQRNIAWIGPTAIQHELRNEFRYSGYISGMKEIGLPYDPIMVEDSYLSVPDGYKAAERLFSRVRPSAVIAANDSIAIGVMRYLKENGIACPGEVMVTGFDNIDVGSFVKPSLTSFDIPRRSIGHFAVRAATDRAVHPREHNIRVSLPYVLIERESTVVETDEEERK